MSFLGPPPLEEIFKLSLCYRRRRYESEGKEERDSLVLPICPPPKAGAGGETSTPWMSRGNLRAKGALCLGPQAGPREAASLKELPHLRAA